jgi:hypothetical protein
MTSRGLLNLSGEEQKRWKEIQEFVFHHAPRRRQVTELFWKKSVEAFGRGDFLSSSILAGITAELAHKTRLLEQGVEMRGKNGRRKSWHELIKHDEKDEDIRKIAKEIKDKHRNVWVHPDLDKIEEHLKRGKGFLFRSDAGMNVASASADFEPLEMTKRLLARLFGEGS